MKVQSTRQLQAMILENAHIVKGTQETAYPSTHPPTPEHVPMHSERERSLWASGPTRSFRRPSHFPSSSLFLPLRWAIKCSLQLFPYFSLQNSQTNSAAPWVMCRMSLRSEILSLHNRSEVSDAQSFNGLAHSGYLKVA